MINSSQGESKLNLIWGYPIKGLSELDAFKEITKKPVK